MTWKECIKGTESESFQICPLTGPEARVTNWNIGDVVWSSGNTFALWRWLSTGTGCLEKCWNLPPWIQGHSARQPFLSGPAWTGGMDQKISRGSSQSQPFCDIYCFPLSFTEPLGLFLTVVIPFISSAALTFQDKFLPSICTVEPCVSDYRTTQRSKNRPARQ